MMVAERRMMQKRISFPAVNKRYWIDSSCLKSFVNNCFTMQMVLPATANP
jgi:hypothetical protein